jgi:hypothetical protein
MRPDDVGSFIELPESLQGCRPGARMLALVEETAGVDHLNAARRRSST